MEMLISGIAPALAVIDQGVDDESEDNDQQDRGDGRGHHMDVIDLLGHPGGGLGEVEPQLGRRVTCPAG